MCPFLHLTGTTVNYAIIVVARTERNFMLHIVDLGDAHASQWLLLLCLFPKRLGASTHDRILRLSIVNEEDEFLSVTGALLAKVAESLHIGFQFHPVKLHINQLLSIAPLDVRSGEALVVISTLQHHCLLVDEFVEVAARPHDRKGKAEAHATMTTAIALLRDLSELSPKLMVVTDQEANHNGEFMGRFDNELNYYGALFDAHEESESLPARGSAMERSDMEWCLLLYDIMYIVACDGAQHRERHERMVKWAEQMTAAWFASTAMSADAVPETAMLGQIMTGCSRAYRVSSEKDVCFFIHWRGILMFFVSTCRAV
ncbi:hypothetical protein VPH35_018513 [Triticum aestivum]